ncbi:eukaryotic translation initiation factor 5-like [Zophobas morio]|jgi:translation initiation factor 5|uniref:eukaryotic translation initiation factor 5-like n=1 Tax=Zophobas morio TaxID=2755281 RepID=UPI003083BB0E
MSVNINTSVEDQFYRYKMPKLISKIEGRGNGIKTVIVNMAEIAKSLSCPPSYPTKFFGCELGSQTVLDDANSRFIVNGSHQDQTLRELLDKFIRKYILCPHCDLPELVTGVKTGLYQGSCGACGWAGPLDNSHKLISYILKNPPNPFGLTRRGKSDNKSERMGKGQPNKKEKSKSKAKESYTERSEHLPIEHLSREKKLGVEGYSGDDDDWVVDTSEEAVRRRREAHKASLSNAVKDMIANELDYIQLPAAERLNLFKDYISDDSVTVKAMFEEAKRLDVMDSGITALVESKLNSKDIIQSIKSNMPLLLTFCQDKACEQKVLLGALERLVGTTRPEHLPKLNQILQLLYEKDVLEEGVIISWAHQLSSSYTTNNALFKKILRSASKFIEWLENAESETDSEEEVTFLHDLDKGKEFERKVYISLADTGNASSARDEPCDTDVEELDIDSI